LGLDEEKVFSPEYYGSSNEEEASSSCSRDPFTKRKIKHGKERNLLVDESANLGQQG
jgi:hypothetical protein